MPNYSGKWSLPTVMQAVAQGNWPAPPPLTAEYVTPGSYSWIAPGFVSAVSVLVIGAGGGGGGGYGGNPYYGGGGGGGGGLTYKNSLTVTPGSSYTVVVG